MQGDICSDRRIQCRLLLLLLSYFFYHKHERRVRFASYIPNKKISLNYKTFDYNVVSSVIFINSKFSSKKGFAFQVSQDKNIIPYIRLYA